MGFKQEIDRLWNEQMSVVKDAGVRKQVEAQAQTTHRKLERTQRSLEQAYRVNAKQSLFTLASGQPFIAILDGKVVLGTVAKVWGRIITYYDSLLPGEFELPGSTPVVPVTDSVHSQIEWMR